MKAKKSVMLSKGCPTPTQLESSVKGKKSDRETHRSKEIIKIEWKGCGQQLRPTSKHAHRRRPRRRMPDHARKKTKSSFYDSWKDNTDYTRRIRSGSLESNLNFVLRPFDNTVFTLRHQPKQRQGTPSMCMMGWWFLLVEMNWRIGK